MTLFTALIILAVGMAIGYRLPALRARWQTFWRARTFKPTVLQPYRPKDGKGGGR